MNEYWLIVYSHRRHGQERRAYANMAWKGGMSDWFRHVKQFDNSEHVLLNAIPISKSQYEWIKDNV